MAYGKGGPVGIGTGAAVLPNTADNSLLFALAIGLIAVGTIVLTASMLAARANRQNG